MERVFRKKIAAQYAVAGLTGGVGRVVEKATERGVSIAAERAVAIYKKKNQKREATKINDIEKPGEKLDTSTFYIMVGLAVVKDLLDIVFAFTIIFSFISSFFSIMISFLTLIYFISNGIKPTTRKFVTILISSIIEFIPFVNAFFPGATINLILVKKFENSDRFKEFAEKKAKLLA